MEDIERSSDPEESESSEGDSDWDEEEWPCNRALPLPEWGTERPELFFEDNAAYIKFASLVEKILKENIARFPYDTLSNFLK